MYNYIMFLIRSAKICINLYLINRVNYIYIYKYYNIK